MIKLDYVLLKNEGNEWKKYIPQDYPKTLEALSCLQGPNSSGKSTILNIIALGLFANKQDSADIEPALKNKIETLLDTNHHKLTFELEVEIPGQGYLLRSRKSDSESKAINMFRVENGREIPFTFENFQRDFRLIYSIPNDPTAQLVKLLNTIQLTQQELVIRISALRNYFKSKIDSIQSSRDEEVLEQLITEKNEYEKNITQIEEEMALASGFKRKLSQLYLVRGYIENNEVILENIRRKNELIDELSKIDVNDRREVREQSRLSRRFSELKDIAIRQRSVAIDVIQKYLGPVNDERLESLRRASLVVEIGNPEIQKTIRRQLDAFIKEISGFRDHLLVQNHDNLKLKELYTTLLHALDNVSFNNLSVPGSNKTVENFRIEVNNAMNELSMKLRIVDDLSTGLSIIKAFKMSIEEAIICRGQLIPQNEQDEDNKRTGDEINQEIAQVEKIRKDAESKKARISEQMVQLRIDPTKSQELFSELQLDGELGPYRTLSNQGIKKAIDDLQNSVDKRRDRLTNLKSFIKEKQARIFIMEQLSSDPDRPYLPNLLNTSEKIYSLLVKFQNQFPQALKRIQSKQPLKGIDEIYAKSIGDFYARKMKTLLYINEELVVDNVNIISEEIYTKDCRTIRFSDFGTGQSQAAYLTTKLAMAGEKKIFALFDEVGTMDTNSLGQVKNKIRELFHKGNLVMALIVQMADTINTNSFVLRENQDE